MIRKYKDLNDIPPSLLTDSVSVEKSPAKTTNQRRKEIIEAGKFIDADIYCSRYKMSDIKDRLKTLYPNCCYCGFHDQQYEVEHYRPKDKYYWLAYSWDNLLYSCTKCNKAKWNHFDIGGTVATFSVNDDISGINNLSDVYDQQEEPLLINPEKITDEELEAFKYHKDGSVDSNNPRVLYTIDKCKLDRDNLRAERKAIWDKFEEQVNAYKWEYRNAPDILKVLLYEVIRQFKRDSEDESLPFTAFRRYAVKSGWIEECIKK